MAALNREGEGHREGGKRGRGRESIRGGRESYEQNVEGRKEDGDRVIERKGWVEGGREGWRMGER